MKNHKKTYFTISIFLIFIIILTSGCSFAKRIPDGVYESKNPYMKFAYIVGGLPDGSKPIQEIEIDGTVHKTISQTDYCQQIFFLEPKNPKDLESTYDSNNYITLAVFEYRLSNDNTKLILTNEATGEVYTLDKIE